MLKSSALLALLASTITFKRKPIITVQTDCIILYNFVLFAALFRHFYDELFPEQVTYIVFFYLLADSLHSCNYATWSALVEC